jgi:hypothetical protein
LNLRQNRYEQHVLPLNYKPTKFNFSMLKIKMSNVSFSQLILLLLIVFLLFGDTSKLINKINLFIKKTNPKKNRKKGT